mmetsp:Transcript_1674/g.4997  ORF Transcript_1674/g.4997 Transcript_1674/m.4997 type:complete len:636 (+) Transcript_1674:534-2441(+)
MYEESSFGSSFRGSGITDVQDLDILRLHDDRDAEIDDALSGRAAAAGGEGDPAGGDPVVDLDDLRDLMGDDYEDDLLSPEEMRALEAEDAAAAAAGGDDAVSFDAAGSFDAGDLDALATEIETMRLGDGGDADPDAAGGGEADAADAAAWHREELLRLAGMLPMHRPPEVVNRPSAARPVPAAASDGSTTSMDSVLLYTRQTKSIHQIRAENLLAALAEHGLDRGQDVRNVERQIRDCDMVEVDLIGLDDVDVLSARLRLAAEELARKETAQLKKKMKPCVMVIIDLCELLGIKGSSTSDGPFSVIGKKKKKGLARRRNPAAPSRWMFFMRRVGRAHLRASPRNFGDIWVRRSAGHAEVNGMCSFGGRCAGDSISFLCLVSWVSCVCCHEMLQEACVFAVVSVVVASDEHYFVYAHVTKMSDRRTHLVFFAHPDAAIYKSSSAHLDEYKRTVNAEPFGHGAELQNAIRLADMYCEPDAGRLTQLTAINKLSTASIRYAEKQNITVAYPILQLTRDMYDIVRATDAKHQKKWERSSRGGDPGAAAPVIAMMKRKLKRESRLLRRSDRENAQLRSLLRHRAGGAADSDDGSSGLATHLLRLRRDTAARILSLPGAGSCFVRFAGGDAVRAGIADAGV